VTGEGLVEPKRRLGRGLEALLRAYPEPDAQEPSAQPPEVARRQIPVGLIDRNPRNPRRDFRAEDLEELAASLRQHGVVQPIVVRQVAGSSERYEIIAGERRWRAAQIAGLHEVPVNVIEASDRQALELAIVENVQRADLNPVEEARGYQALIEEFSYSQSELGDVIGKSRVHVANTLRLLKLPGPILELLANGTLSAGHGRALLAAHDPEKLAKLIVKKSLSVREAERLAQASDERPTQKRHAVRNADIAALEKELAGALGLNVVLNHASGGGGELRIQYRTLEQLEAVCRKLRA
jgi:ParB family transcriptional regulator, chromosome partitioning protein